MNLKKLLFSLIFVAFGALTALTSHAVMHVEVYRKEYTKKDGSQAYRYRFALGDWHRDYADGRIREQQQAGLISIMQRCPQSFLIVEDKAAYPAGLCPQIRQKWINYWNYVVNTEYKSWKGQNPRYNYGPHGALFGLTHVCNQAKIACHNVEFRHLLEEDQLFYKDALKLVDQHYTPVKNHSQFALLFPRLYAKTPQQSQIFRTGYLDYVINQAQNYKAASPMNQADKDYIELKVNRLIDAKIICALLDHEDEMYPYGFVAAGAGHIRRLSTDDKDREIVDYWQTMGYTKIASFGTDLPYTEKNEAQILANAIDIGKVLAPFVPQVAPTKIIAQPVYTTQQKKAIVPLARVAIARKAQTVAIKNMAQKSAAKPIAKAAVKAKIVTAKKPLTNNPGLINRAALRPVVNPVRIPKKIPQKLPVKVAARVQSKPARMTMPQIKKPTPIRKTLPIRTAIKHQPQISRVHRSRPVIKPAQAQADKNLVNKIIQNMQTLLSLSGYKISKIVANTSKSQAIMAVGQLKPVIQALYANGDLDAHEMAHITATLKHLCTGSDTQIIRTLQGLDRAALLAATQSPATKKALSSLSDKDLKIIDSLISKLLQARNR